MSLLGPQPRWRIAKVVGSIGLFALETRNKTGLRKNIVRGGSSGNLRLCRTHQSESSMVRERGRRRTFKVTSPLLLLPLPQGCNSIIFFQSRPRRRCANMACSCLYGATNCVLRSHEWKRGASLSWLVNDMISRLNTTGYGDSRHYDP